MPNAVRSPSDPRRRPTSSASPAGMTTLPRFRCRSRRRPRNIANSFDEFRALVRKVHKYGADVIKVAMTGGVLSQGDLVGAERVSPAQIQAIVDEAHRLRPRVVVHVHGTE